MFLAAQSHQVRELLNENTLVAKAQQLAGELETDMAAHQDVRQRRLNLSRADRLLRPAAGLTELYAQIASRRNPAASTNTTGIRQPLLSHLAGTPRTARPVE